MTLKLTRIKKGMRYLYLPNCRASKFLCRIMNRGSLSSQRIRDFEELFEIKFEIEVPK
jgi:hypothetical protein